MAAASSPIRSEESERKGVIRSRSRRSRRVVRIALLVGVVFVGLTARLFVWPDVNAPVRSDAIIVLGGNGDRIGEGFALAKAGWAPLLIFSFNSAQRCYPSTSQYAIKCFHPDPSSTRGEAEAIRRLAKQLHLHRIILVVTTPQATRARLRVEHCYSGQILIVGVSPGGVGSWALALAYEWGALFKALVLQPSC